MQPLKFLLSQAGFFVYIKMTNILGNSFCFELGTNGYFGFVPGIKLFIFEMCSCIPLEI
jgi:hypothetical protein